MSENNIKQVFRKVTYPYRDLEHQRQFSHTPHAATENLMVSNVVKNMTKDSVYIFGNKIKMTILRVQSSSTQSDINMSQHVIESTFHFTTKGLSKTLFLQLIHNVCYEVDIFTL